MAQTIRNSRPRRPTAVDLFAGCGGLTVGLKRAGFTVLGAVEINRLAADTYRTNHPSVAFWRRDIRKLSAERILRRLQLRPGQLDLLAGCPPCQGYSTIRTRNRRTPVEDHRNDLIFEFLRLVNGLRPRAIMLENVPGLQHDERFGRFCDGLRRLGYRIYHRVLDAAEFGVPQRRRRLILLACRRHLVLPASPAPVRESVRSAIDGLPAPGESGDPVHDVYEKRSERIQQLIEDIPVDGGSRIDLGEQRQLACHKRLDGFKDVYGRMAWDEVAPTITSGFVNPSKGRFLHPEQNRTITPREAALLQTFPADYHFPIEAGKFPVAEMIGNALPPEFIRRHAVGIAEMIRRRPTRRV
ncbi:MAG TPA: DNA cytosine methyltransferase [Acidobacteriaceae bacterium]|nr:DNA cytosine methyltransferase [Acidobacteriaceae bacterium]